eukprot:767162-Hanusia_phi.AAC.4
MLLVVVALPSTANSGTETDQRHAVGRRCQQSSPWQAGLVLVQACLSHPWRQVAATAECDRGDLHDGPEEQRDSEAEEQRPAGPTDVRALIDPRYLSDNSDLVLLHDLWNSFQSIKTSPSAREWILAELLPGALLRHGEGLGWFKWWVKLACSSYFHPVGTCRMPSAREWETRTRKELSNVSVVDAFLRSAQFACCLFFFHSFPTLVWLSFLPTSAAPPTLRRSRNPSDRVHGTVGLRIADASIAPRIPSVPTQAMAYMIGYQAAQLMLGRCSPQD